MVVVVTIIANNPRNHAEDEGSEEVMKRTIIVILFVGIGWCIVVVAFCCSCFCDVVVKEHYSNDKDFETYVFRASAPNPPGNTNPLSGFACSLVCFILGIRCFRWFT